MSLTQYEQETIIRWCPDKEEPLSIYTHSKPRAEKLIAKGAKLIRESKHNGKAVAWTLEAPREWLKWPSPRRRGGKGNPAALQNARQAQKAKL